VWLVGRGVLAARGGIGLRARRFLLLDLGLVVPSEKFADAEHAAYRSLERLTILSQPPRQYPGPAFLPILRRFGARSLPCSSTLPSGAFRLAPLAGSSAWLAPGRCLAGAWLVPGWCLAGAWPWCLALVLAHGTRPGRADMGRGLVCSAGRC